MLRFLTQPIYRKPRPMMLLLLAIVVIMPALIIPNIGLGSFWVVIIFQALFVPPIGWLMMRTARVMNQQEIETAQARSARLRPWILGFWSLMLVFLIGMIILDLIFGTPNFYAYLTPVLGMTAAILSIIHWKKMPR